MSDLSHILEAFGGLRPFARALNKPPSTVQYWIEKGGLPSSVVSTVFDLSETQGLGLSRNQIQAASLSAEKMSSLADSDDFHHAISSIEEIIDEARNGRMYILVDAEDRENEGDLIIPAQFATPTAVNFMATHGRGLICLAMTAERANILNLEPMTRDNQESMGTAFTVSIEAKEGVTTGISAHDRARTVAVAIDPTKTRHDIVTPGHVFPLMAKDGGVLVRAGHTEAAVDISRMAGLYPAGVICEIMNEDGSMARLPDLVGFAQRHNLKIGTIADLIAYRRRNDRFLERRIDVPFQSEHADGFRAIVFKNTLDGTEHLALVHGKISPEEPVLTRVHRVNFMSDVLSEKGKRSGLVESAMKTIAEADEPGVVILINSARNDSLAESLGAASEKPADPTLPLREYGVGAQIMKDLGIRKMIILTTQKPSRVAGLDGYGLSLEGWRLLKEV
ncbi:MAG: 3,4-dihydroxy-2-butanone-4-phosphate synthase [Ponticaulis sp.]|nr:3,4-dihydroxy-2-butanone-4-phosphate synthase [Ponticaulis sp.]|tara:strand:- start:8080 stop:9426 length:1347 start_codon:yes stop_codon:yes gene_type:complete